MNKDFYTVEEAAHQLGIPPSRIYYLRRIGLITMEKQQKDTLSIAKAWMVPRSEVSRLKAVAEQKQD